MTPPPDSLRVWVCPECGRDWREGLPAPTKHGWRGKWCHAAPVEYLPATDLEQLRERYEELVAAAVPLVELDELSGAERFRAALRDLQEGRDA